MKNAVAIFHHGRITRNPVKARNPVWRDLKKGGHLPSGPCGSSKLKIVSRVNDPCSQGLSGRTVRATPSGGGRAGGGSVAAEDHVRPVFRAPTWFSSRGTDA